VTALLALALVVALSACTARASSTRAVAPGGVLRWRHPVPCCGGLPYRGHRKASEQTPYKVVVWEFRTLHAPGR
jgi:hypothetical protein